MAERNIKLVNPQKFDVGIKTFDRPNGMNIQHGSFVLVTEDEVNYITSISNVIQRGILRIENSFGQKEDRAGQLMNELGLNADDSNFATEEDIRKHLSASVKKIEEWLDGITEEYMLDKIYDVAMSMADKLTAQKFKVLSAKMPDKEFI